jgi:hypothetical protein
MLKLSLATLTFEPLRSLGNGTEHHSTSRVRQGPLLAILPTGAESSEPQRVSSTAVPSLPMHPSMRHRNQHYLDKRREPYVG